MKSKLPENHWYKYTDIHQLLIHYTNDGKNYYVSEATSQNTEHLTQIISASVDNLQRGEFSAAAIPINLGDGITGKFGIHWVSLVIRQEPALESGITRLVAFYNDSYGDSVDKSIPHLKQILENHGIMPSNFTDLRVVQQEPSNGYDCGPWTVMNLDKLARSLPILLQDENSKAQILEQRNELNILLSQDDSDTDEILGALEESVAAEVTATRSANTQFDFNEIFKAENLDLPEFKFDDEFSLNLSEEDGNLKSPALSRSEVKAKVEQVFSSELSAREKLEELRGVEKADYKPLVKQLAYKKTEGEFRQLAELLEDIGDLVKTIGDLNTIAYLDTEERFKFPALKYYTDAVIFYQYAITIIDEKLLDNKSTDSIYQKITGIRQDIVNLIRDPETAVSRHLEAKTIQEIKEDIDANKGILLSLRSDVKGSIERIDKLDSRSEEYISESEKLFTHIAKTMKGFLAKIFKDSEAEIGLAPCKYTVIGLGSLALQQATPYSDLEFAIVTENSDYTMDPDPRVRNYFKNLTHLVNFKIINLGESIIPTSRYDLDMSHLVHQGVNLDLGGKTPLGRIDSDKPYDLVKTIDGMMWYVRNEEDKAEHIDKSLPNILLQTCYIYGNKDLTNIYQKEVLEFLHSPADDGRKQCEIRATKILKEGAIEIEYEKSYNLGLKFCGDIAKLQPLNVDVPGQLFDVKQEIYRLPDRFLYNLWLYYYGTEADNIYNIIEQLHRVEIINSDASLNLKYALTFALILRLKTYTHNKGQIEDMSLFVSVALEDGNLIDKTMKTFHLSKEELEEGGKLFRYYYVVLPLYDRLKEFCDNLNQLTTKEKFSFFKDNLFYENTFLSRGLIHRKLLQHEEAKFNLEQEMSEWHKSDFIRYRDLEIIQILAVLYSKLGEYDKAIDKYEYGLKIYRKFSKCEFDIDIARCLHNIGTIHLEQGILAEAEIYYEESLKTLRFVCKNQSHADIAICLDSIGNVFSKQGQFDNAKKCYEESLQLRYDIYKQGPHPDIANSLWHLGSIYENLKMYEKAKQYYEESLRIVRIVYKSEPHTDIAICLDSIGNVFSKQGQSNDAKKCYEESLKILREIYKGESNISEAHTISNYGALLCKEGMYVEGRKYYEKSLRIQREIFKGKPHPDVAIALYNIGDLYYAEGMYKNAIKYFFEASKIIDLFQNHHSVNTLVKNKLELISTEFAEFYSLDIDNIINKTSNFKSQDYDFANYESHYNVAQSLDKGYREEILEEYLLALIFLPEKEKEKEKEIKLKLLNLGIKYEEVELWQFVVNGNFERINELLATEVNFNHVSFMQFSPLIQAIRNGNEEVVKTLVNCGASINIPKDDLASPLYCSLGYLGQEININIVRFLLDHGANPNQEMDDGDTPMHVAHYYGNLGAIKLLSARRAEFNTLNHAGEVPLDYLLKSDEIEDEIKAEIIREFRSEYDSAKLANYPQFAKILEDDGADYRSDNVFETQILGRNVADIDDNAEL